MSTTRRKNSGNVLKTRLNSRPSTPRTGTTRKRDIPPRKFVVFVSLVGGLTLTSALLLALAPEALHPNAVKSLFAVGDSQSMDLLFETSAALQPGRWKYVLVHHSRTESGDAATIAAGADGAADHFVIGNGFGCQDGEIQITQRWVQQAGPGAIAGLPPTQPNFISVCLIGDFDQTRPTAAQQVRLVQLLNALQHRLQIDPRNIVLPQTGAGLASVGGLFPLASVKSQLLP